MKKSSQKRVSVSSDSEDEDYWKPIPPRAKPSPGAYKPRASFGGNFNRGGRFGPRQMQVSLKERWKKWRPCLGAADHTLQ